MTATDDFNRADGGLGANWTTYTNVEPPLATPVIASNIVRGIANRHTGSYRNAETYSTNQYSQVVLAATLAEGNFIGACVRCSSDGSSMYSALLFWQNATPEASTSVKLYVETASSFALLASGSAQGVQPVGAVLWLGVQGSTVTARLNGEIQASVTDTTLTTGRPGFLLWDTAGIDNWEGGDNEPPVFGPVRIAQRFTHT